MINSFIKKSLDPVLMKIFITEDGDKVNFIDENNVILGYDLTQDCCEQASWFIADNECEASPESGLEKKQDLTGWFFDPDILRK